MATVHITIEARQQANDLPKAMHARFMKIIKRLQDWPEVSGAKALSGDLAGWYRIRFGDYRLLFTVKGEVVTIRKIGHRKDVYEG